MLGDVAVRARPDAPVGGEGVVDEADGFVKKRSGAGGRVEDLDAMDLPADFAVLVMCVGDFDGDLAVVGQAFGAGEVAFQDGVYAADNVVDDGFGGVVDAARFA